jgi:hypothetical protein
MQHWVLDPTLVQSPISFNQFMLTISAKVEWRDIAAPFRLAH